MKYPSRRASKLDSGSITVGMASTTPRHRLSENLKFGKQHLELARELCTRTLSRMADPDEETIKNAKFYFLFSNNSEFHQYKSTVIRSIDLIRSGLMGDVLLKIYTATTREGLGMYGYVKMRSTASKKGHEAQNYVRAFSMHADANNKHYSQKRTGSIHILASRLCDENLGVQTLLHEASHRYAGTHDGGDAGYFESDGTPGTAFTLTDAKAAVHNADSFAWFIVRTGRIHDTQLGIAI
jgi:hypothetical protein